MSEHELKWLRRSLGQLIDELLGSEAWDKAEDEREVIRLALLEIKSLRAPKAEEPQEEPVDDARPLVVFDLETTGFDKNRDRIVQFAAVKVDSKLEETTNLTLLINPERDIPEAASKVHGITNEKVCALPPFRKFQKEIVDFLEGCDIVGHNVVKFDLPFLRAELERCGAELKTETVIDTLTLARRYRPGKSNKLGDVYKACCGKDLEGAHDALADARGSLLVLKALMEKHGLTLEEAVKPKKEKKAAPRQWFQKEENGTLRFCFGKYNGRLLHEIEAIDQQYVDWVVRTLPKEAVALIEGTQ